MLESYVDKLPEDVREQFKADIAGLVSIKSREDAAKLIAEHPHLKSERDAIISRTTENYALKFREEKLPGLLQEEVKKLNPPKDPKDQALAEMQAELAKIKRDALLKDRKAVAMQRLTEAGLPVDLSDFALDEDENIFASKIEKLLGLNAWVDGERKKVLTGAVGSQSSPKTGDANTTPLEAQYRKAMESGDITAAMAIKSKLAAAQ
jgi:hypothetical protein